MLEKKKKMSSIKYMSCYHPFYALILRKKNPEGKMDLKLLPNHGSLREYQNQYGSQNVLSLPCGHCIGCAKDRVRNWTTRLCLEGKYHDRKCFLTLTYDNEHCPDRLVKRDLQLFLKRLRKEISPIKVRYFACGEYGETTKRPHYHVILFGYDFPDKCFFSFGSNLDKVYISKQLSKIWSFGNCLIGDVSEQSCAYVAGYSTKKLIGDSPFKDEFVMMSTKPGIGSQYLEDNPDIYQVDKIYDSCLGSSKVARIPRFFDKKSVDAVERVKPFRVEKSQMIATHKMMYRGEKYLEEVLKSEEKIAVYTPRFRVKGI